MHTVQTSNIFLAHAARMFHVEHSALRFFIGCSTWNISLTRKMQILFKKLFNSMNLLRISYVVIKMKYSRTHLLQVH